jgi:hypothetical protein
VLVWQKDPHNYTYSTDIAENLKDRLSPIDVGILSEFTKITEQRTNLPRPRKRIEIMRISKYINAITTIDLYIENNQAPHFPFPDEYRSGSAQILGIRAEAKNTVNKRRLKEDSQKEK